MLIVIDLFKSPSITNNKLFLGNVFVSFISSKHVFVCFSNKAGGLCVTPPPPLFICHFSHSIPSSSLSLQTMLEGGSLSSSSTNSPKLRLAPPPTPIYPSTPFLLMQQLPGSFAGNMMRVQKQLIAHFFLSQS